jgi:ABC-type sugar transport system ATPase subunit
VRTMAGYVFQNAALFDSLNVLDNVLMGFRSGARALPRNPRPRLGGARPGEPGPAAVFAKLPSLSGGMKKRGIARRSWAGPASCCGTSPPRGWTDQHRRRGPDRPASKDLETTAGQTTTSKGSGVRPGRHAEGTLRFWAPPRSSGPPDPVVRAFVDRAAEAALDLAGDPAESDERAGGGPPERPSDEELSAPAAGQGRARGAGRHLRGRGILAVAALFLLTDPARCAALHAHHGGPDANGVRGRRCCEGVNGRSAAIEMTDRPRHIRWRSRSGRSRDSHTPGRRGADRRTTWRSSGGRRPCPPRRTRPGLGAKAESWNPPRGRERRRSSPASRTLDHGTVGRSEQRGRPGP